MLNQTISHYKILSKLGGGGMGVVYKAEDLKLKRLVALKFLPPELSGDDEAKERFIHEAQAASALDHPNICTIYEIGETEDEQIFIAMAYYEGETLKKKVASEQLSANSVIEIATQIAQGLAKAHEKGIVHRDIKPANVFVTNDGLVKILDFGLAKLAGATQLTKPGTTMGTAAYMSPEQVQQLEVDHRTDIWSLGVVMYEMLTGKLPFEGVYEQAVMYAIVNMQPESVRSLRSEVSVGLESIVSRCLEKQSEDRYQTVSDLQAALQNIRSEEAGRVVSPLSERTRRSNHIIWSVAFSAFVMIAWALFLIFKPFSKRSSEPLVAVPLTSYPGVESFPTFSPDGKQIAFTWDKKGESDREIYVKLIDVGEPVQITNSPGWKFRPAWSPDGRYIAFARLIEYAVKKYRYSIHIIPALGGVERELLSLDLDIMRSDHNISWSPDGKFLAVPYREKGQELVSLYLLSLETLEKHKLTTPPALYQGDFFSAFSPDGKTLAFIRQQSRNVSSINIISSTGGESQQLYYNEKSRLGGLTWTPDGREIVFSGSLLGGDGLWRIPAAGGTPELVPVAGGTSFGSPTISRQGNRLAYAQVGFEDNIWRLDIPAAKEQSAAPYELISSSQRDWAPHISPDGSRIVFQSFRAGGSGQIWMCDSNGHNAVQLTSLTADAGSPRWSPDGQHIAFDSRPEGHSDIFMLNVDGGNPQRVTTEASDDITPSWSWDGRWIYFASNRSGSSEVWRIPAQGGDAVQITTGADAITPFESFDGQWVYYAKQKTSGVWKAPIQGGKESLIMEFPPFGHWMKLVMSKDGIYSIYHDDDVGHTIEFFNFATGKLTRIAQLPREGGIFTMAASPDRRWFLYSLFEETGDIMLVENFR